MSFCPKCGTQVTENAAFCPICGSAFPNTDIPNHSVQANSQPDTPPAPNYSTPEQENLPHKAKNKKMLIILVAIVAVVAILIGVFSTIAASNKEKEKAKKDYLDTLETAYEEMLSGGQLAEEYCSLESKVWRNCIYESASTETDKYTKNSYGWFYDDFNTALANFYLGEIENYNTIEENFTTVKKLMQDIKDIPEGFEEEFEDECEAIQEMYLSYSKLCDLVLGDSSYSWTTFSETLEDAKAEFKSSSNSAELLVG